jgi:hypothetical protein
MTQTSQLTIEHVVIQSTRSYEEVKAALEECLRVMANTDGRKRKQVEEDRQAEEQASLQLKDAEALVIIDVSHRYRQLIEARKELEAVTALQPAARQWEALCHAQIGGLTLATAVTLFIVPVLYSIFVPDMKIIRWEESVATAIGPLVATAAPRVETTAADAPA